MSRKAQGKSAISDLEVSHKYPHAAVGLHQSKLSLSQRLTNSSNSTGNKKESKNAMKVFAIIFVSAIVAYASATVLPEIVYDGPIQGEDGEIITLEDVDTDGGLSTSTELSPIRHRRVTCDLLSIQTPWLGFNHSACAARCLFQKRKGGSCRGGVCHCRG